MFENESEFLDLMASWRNDGLTPVANIIGFSKYLLDELSEDIAKEHLEILTLIHQNGIRAEKSWRSPALYVALRYGNASFGFQGTDLNKVINKALDDLQDLIDIENIKVVVPDDLPLVRSIPFIINVFNYLLDSIEYRNYLMDNLLTIDVQVSDMKNVTVRFEAEKEVLRESDLERFFYPGSPQSVARLIIQQHDKDLRISNMNQETVIEFELQIWDESTYRAEAV